MRAIQHHQKPVLPRAKRGQLRGLLSSGHSAIKERKHELGADGIEQPPNLIIAGNLLKAEEGVGVTFSLPGLPIALIGQKGGALGEKHRKGPQSGSDQGVVSVR